MSKLASVITLVVLATGCQSKRAKYAASGVSVAAGIASIVAAPPARDCNPPPPDLEMDPLGLQTIGATFCKMDQNMRTGMIVGGVAMIIAGVVYAARVDLTPARLERPEQPAREQIPDIESIREPQTTDPTLRQLTAQAAMAARAGHCSAVKILGERIAKIDLSYRTTGFTADASIAACLR